MDRTGRAIGMTVFAIGIAVLIIVFAIAYSMFTSSWAQLMGAQSGTNHLSASDLGNGLAAVLVKVILLFLMTIVGSMIASRGIHLYLGSNTGKKAAIKKKTEFDQDA